VEKEGKKLEFPIALVNAATTAEKAAELVEQASREFLEGLNREYRRQMKLLDRNQMRHNPEKM
jgi:hypothetical protein